MHLFHAILQSRIGMERNSRMEALRMCKHIECERNFRRMQLSLQVFQRTLHRSPKVNLLQRSS